VLDDIYAIVKSDLLAHNPAVEHESHIIDDRSITMDATLLQQCLVEVSDSSSGASSRSMSQSPDLPNSSRHTTPVAEYDFLEPNTLSSKDVFLPVSVATSAPSAAKGPHSVAASANVITASYQALLEPVSPKPKLSSLERIHMPINAPQISPPTMDSSTKVVESVSLAPISSSAMHAQASIAATSTSFPANSLSTATIEYGYQQPQLAPKKPTSTKRAQGLAKVTPKTFPAIVKGPSSSALRPIFIHPPFNTFPDSHLHPEGLSYDLLVANTDWFLDPADFVSTSPDAVPYPRRLDPSTSMAMTGMVDNNGQAPGADRRLRCTFCRRTYTGEDAGRAWQDHVIEQHSIILDHDRHDNSRPQVRNMTSG
jgi:hypothetical protein